MFVYVNIGDSDSDDSSYESLLSNDDSEDEKPLNNNIFDKMTAYFYQKLGDEESLHQRWKGQLKTYFILMETLTLLSAINDFTEVPAALEQFIQLGRRLHNPDADFIEHFLDTNYFSSYCQILKTMQSMPVEELKIAFREQQRSEDIQQLFTIHGLEGENLGLWTIVGFFSNATLATVLSTPNISNTITSDMLVVAAKLNDFEKLQHLLKAADPDNISDLLSSPESFPPYNTVLHYAVFNKNLEMVCAILTIAKNHGIGIELCAIQNLAGNTALHLAAYAPFEHNQQGKKLDIAVDEKCKDIIPEESTNFSKIHADLLAINQPWFTRIQQINQAIIDACGKGRLSELFFVGNEENATFLHVAAQFHEDFITYFKFIAAYLSIDDLNRLRHSRADLQDRKLFGLEKPSHSGKKEAATLIMQAIFFSLLTAGVAAAPFLAYGSTKAGNYAYNKNTSHSLRGTMAWHYHSKWSHVATQYIQQFDDIMADYNCFHNIRKFLRKNNQVPSHTRSNSFTIYFGWKDHFCKVFLPTIDYILKHDDQRYNFINIYNQHTPLSVVQIEELSLQIDSKSQDNAPLPIILLTPQIIHSNSRSFFKEAAKSQTYKKLCDRVISLLAKDPNFVDKCLTEFLIQLSNQAALVAPIESSFDISYKK